MTVTRPRTNENRIVLHTDWAGYLKFLDAAEGRHVRITYDRGDIELMSPSDLHEFCKKFLAQLVEAALLREGRDYRPGGSTTFSRKMLARGLEPDECYWIQTFQTLGPPGQEEVFRPDLVLEVEISRSVLDRLGIYAALGVPEIWRFDEDLQLHVEVLGPAGYTRAERSPALPDLAIQELPRFVQLGLDKGSRLMLVAFAEWQASGA